MPAADATPTGAPATGVPIIRYLGYDWHAFEIAIDGTGRRAVPDFDIKPELGVDPDAPWVTDKNASPDGRFTVIVNGDEVHVQPIDASASDTIFAVPLGDGSRNARMSWSPDSRYLAVWSGGSGALTPHSMWLLDVTRGTTTAGPIGSIGFIQSAWSPDGAHIAVGGREGMNVTTASTGETEVLRMGADVSGYMDLEWAPDGRSLTFGPMTADYEIHRVNADATGRKRLAVGTGAKWMPDGSRIAFLAPSADLVGPGWQFQIWTMRPDGSDKRPLVTEPCPCSGLKWSADGRWLIFIASHGEHDDIWVVGADGRNARRLARDANIVEWVSP